MDCKIALPPEADESFNACLASVYRYSKAPMFLPCHKNDTAMDTAITIWNRVIIHKGLFQKIISDRNPRLASAEGMIQNPKKIIRRFCAYGLEFEESDEFTHDWCTLIPALELVYMTSIFSSTGKTPAMLEKGFNSRLT
ncbi:hypothetical protein O181_055571 [Austropuccinia psidii MF-1]|uniref:Uncharacterized protein n=1 Tax=Austropuccinia psidii MF-1 TaxID=1389203 RepID=A0A9Q3EBM2_9BASI|nr:hypothetical protein [Austropuccinia psidii MF-1]